MEMAGESSSIIFDDALYQASDCTQAVAGSVGPLYYADVKVAATPGRALIDTGSPATIMSFKLFKTIGKAANISSNSLLPVDPGFMLKDYNQRTIPIGAKVNLEIGWKDASVTVAVYLAEMYGEPFLLGTNAVMPLGLMTPDPGVKAIGTENTEDSRSRLGLGFGTFFRYGICMLHAWIGT